MTAKGRTVLSGSQLNISIQNCNSVSSLDLALSVSELTVLYGPNGAGKSTVARAIAAQAGIHAEELGGMVPYGSSAEPSVAGLPANPRIMVFNEDYVDETLFQDDDHLIADGYHVFIETPDYRRALANTRALFGNAHKQLEARGDLTELMETMRQLLACYGRAKTGYSKAGDIGKGVAQLGNVVDNVPSDLAAYAPLIQSTRARDWIAWRGKGKDFESSGVCPYCAGGWAAADTVLGERLQDTYGGKYIDHRTAVLAAFGRSEKYLGASAAKEVRDLLSMPLSSGIPAAADDLLRIIRCEAETLLGHLEKIESLDFVTLRDVSGLRAHVEGLKIDAGTFRHINSAEVLTRIDAVNSVLDDLVARIANVEKAVGVQKSALRKAVNASKAEMDGFLESAGFPYELSIDSDDGSSCVVVLSPRGLGGSVPAPRRRLSYGERNALAIALFAAQVRRDEPDLVVLDDPISSFDQSKKYAIMQHLFAKAGGACAGLTTLLLTHDPESLAMLMKVHTGRLCPLEARFLRNVGGVATAAPVEPSDMESIVVWLRSQARGCSDLPGRIAFARQLLELEGDKGMAWSYLSCLVHRKDVPDAKDGAGGFRPMTAVELADAQAVLAGLGFPETDYAVLLSWLSDAELLRRAGAGFGPVEKVCAFRILATSDPGAMRAAADRAGVGETVFEFASEYFHVENLLAYTLDPMRFSTVPATVLDAVDKVMGEYGEGLGIPSGGADGPVQGDGRDDE